MPKEFIDGKDLVKETEPVVVSGMRVAYKFWIEWHDLVRWEPHFESESNEKEMDCNGYESDSHEGEIS